jgi:hypothetical protein
VTKQECSCGATCSQVEALSNEVAKLKREALLSYDEIVYLRRKLGIDKYGNTVSVKT